MRSVAALLTLMALAGHADAGPLYIAGDARPRDATLPANGSAWVWVEAAEHASMFDIARGGRGGERVPVERFVQKTCDGYVVELRPRAALQPGAYDYEWRDVYGGGAAFVGPFRVVEPLDHAPSRPEVEVSSRESNDWHYPRIRRLREEPDLAMFAIWSVAPGEEIDYGGSPAALVPHPCGAGGGCDHVDAECLRTRAEQLPRKLGIRALDWTGRRGPAIELEWRAGAAPVRLADPPADPAPASITVAPTPRLPAVLAVIAGGALLAFLVGFWRARRGDSHQVPPSPPVA